MILPEGWWRDPRTRKRVFISALLAGVPVGTGVIVYLAESYFERSGSPFRGLTVAFAAVILTFLATTTFAALYTADMITQLMFEGEGRRRPSAVQTFRDPLEFAKFRMSLVMRIQPSDITEAIYCTSHCNLFARPGGADETTNIELRAINKIFFRHLAELSMEAPRGGLNLLLQYGSLRDADVKTEMAERLSIWMGVCVKREDVNLKREQFDARHLLPPSLKDYFVIEDHIFKTIRKTPASGGSTHFVYMRSAEIAQTYRDWLADVFRNGHHEENGVLYTEETQLARFMRKLWTDLSEGEDFKNSVLKEGRI